MQGVKVTYILHTYIHCVNLLLFSKEKEIAGLQQNIEEDQTNIAALQRKIRELEAKIEELEEDLENERALRKRVR